MTTQPECPEEARWLLEPPVPGEVKLSLAVGEGAEVTPELREAFEALLRALHEEEVQGYVNPGCRGLCFLRRYQCSVDYQCRIIAPSPAG